MFRLSVERLERNITSLSFQCRISPGVVCRVFKRKPASARPKPGAGPGQSHLWPDFFPRASAQLTDWTSQHQLTLSWQTVHTYSITVDFHAGSLVSLGIFPVCLRSCFPQQDTSWRPFGPIFVCVCGGGVEGWVHPGVVYTQTGVHKGEGMLPSVGFFKDCLPGSLLYYSMLCTVCILL